MENPTHILVPIEVWKRDGFVRDLTDETSVFEIDLSENGVEIEGIREFERLGALGEATGIQGELMWRAGYEAHGRKLLNLNT